MKDKVMDAVQRLSNGMFFAVLILPIAGIILALVMTMEFIRIIMDKNN